MQSDDSAAQMTDRVLTMLYQFLLSNQALELNETFQIYLKVLSNFLLELLQPLDSIIISFNTCLMFSCRFIMINIIEI